MIFSSPAFLAFFVAYLAAHHYLPDRYRLALVIAGSAFFYGFWNPAYVVIPFLLIVAAYWGARWVAAAADPGPRQGRVLAVTGVLFIPLCFYKYTNFLYVDVLALFVPGRAPLIDYALPLGISFVTFTMVAYVVDVYRRDFPVEGRLSMLTGYTLFFPQLIAGPILRPGELIPKLEGARRASRSQFALGFAVFSVGLLKKLVFADPIGEAVDHVYAAAGVLGGWDYLLAIFGFTVQIYCDFSGYTDMGIGSALMLGVRLPGNFDRPYLATSVVAFWRHWHMTLSNWLRDYLYIPLGGSRKGAGRDVRNLMLTMGLGGLWHGAHWTFVLWGLLHGCGIVAGHLFRKLGGRRAAGVPRPARMLVTFLFVTLAWILFRAPDLGVARRMVTGPFTASYAGLGGWLSHNGFYVLLVAVFLSTHWLDTRLRLRLLVSRYPGSVVWTGVALVWVLAVAVSTGSSAKFIYFDF